MWRLLEKIFNALARTRLGQVFAATVVGALLPVLVWRKLKNEIPVDQLPYCCLGFAGIGFAAGLILTMPKLLFGTLLSVLGGFVAVAPMSRASGEPFPWSAHAIKIAIGVALLGTGIWMIVSKLRSIRRSRRTKSSP